jgi:hypothetical protein
LPPPPDLLAASDSEPSLLSRRSTDRDIEAFHNLRVGEKRPRAAPAPRAQAEDKPAQPGAAERSVVQRRAPQRGLAQQGAMERAAPNSNAAPERSVIARVDLPSLAAAPPTARPEATSAAPVTRGLAEPIDHPKRERPAANDTKSGKTAGGKTSPATATQKPGRGTSGEGKADAPQETKAPAQKDASRSEPRVVQRSSSPPAQPRATNRPVLARRAANDAGARADDHSGEDTPAPMAQGVLSRSPRRTASPSAGSAGNNPEERKKPAPAGNGAPRATKLASFEEPVPSSPPMSLPVGLDFSLPKQAKPAAPRTK